MKEFTMADVIEAKRIMEASAFRIEGGEPRKKERRPVYDNINYAKLIADKENWPLQDRWHAISKSDYILLLEELTKEELQDFKMAGGLKILGFNLRIEDW